jgi:microcystin-dependent protein
MSGLSRGSTTDIFLYLPAGVILPFGGDVPPDGWAICDGSVVNRVEYAELFNAIGTNWGHGNGTTTFHLPDLRGRFMRGKNAGTGRDPLAGSRTAANTGGATGDATGSVQSHGFSSHNHGGGNHQHGLTRAIFQSVSPAYEHGYDNVHGRPEGGTPVNFSGSTVSSQGDGDNRPINANVTYIIKL